MKDLCNTQQKKLGGVMTVGTAEITKNVQQKVFSLEAIDKVYCI